jgi:hypothetical protein
MNVHGALNHRVWRVGVHYVEDRMNYLIALDPQERRSKDLFRFGIHQNFMNPSVSPFSTARATRVIERFPIKAFRPDFRTSASVIPALPNGGSM